MGVQVLKAIRQLAAAILGAVPAAAVAVVAAGQALPPGSRVDPSAHSFPAQRLEAEQAGGRQSFLVGLGNLVFSSPLLFGEPARSAGVSCNSCHTNGHVNRDFFIPGHSLRPGGLAPTDGLLNPAAGDGVGAHVDIPSLRGVRHLGPYGRDGRISSLREFTRHVIVDEFAGPEPSPLLLDALMAYQNEFAFLPNPRLGPLGRLTISATTWEREGERLFRETRGVAGLACGDCHRPTSLFTDGRRYDLSTGGVFRTPTLLNANSSAPYGHDGRWADYAAALDGHEPALGLELSKGQRTAILAYLDAVGDAEDAEEPATFGREMAELASYVRVLDGTIGHREVWLTGFVVETLVAELDRIQRAWPEGEAAHQRRRPDRAKIALDYNALRDSLRATAVAPDGVTARAALAAYLDLAGQMVANYPGASSPVR